MSNTQDRIAQKSSQKEQEGVIKYSLRFREQNLSGSLLSAHLSEKSLNELVEALNSSRTSLSYRGLIGQYPCRYGGDGFGNISVRVHGLNFLISGSQTGHLKTLGLQSLAWVDQFNIQQNHLSAYGLTKPSSESMTHGVCYQACASIGAVVHVHSPEIWSASDRLQLPCTDQTIPYGTPEMAQTVLALLKTHHQVNGTTVFAMKGHEDGIVAAGKHLASCTSSLLDYLEQLSLL